MLASSCSDVAILMCHPASVDCMILDESSLLCDDVEITPTPVETVQGGHGIIDENKMPSMAELSKSQEALRKDKARAQAHYRLEFPKLKASEIEAFNEIVYDEKHPE